jgi:TPR repeat protein
MKHLSVILLLLFSTTCWSADFQKGRDAYKRGDYATALKEWTPLAEQGDAEAQFNLGSMYEKGRGVPQVFTPSSSADGSMPIARKSMKTSQ